jgi:hypothetical protein
LYRFTCWSFGLLFSFLNRWWPPNRPNGGRSAVNAAVAIALSTNAKPPSNAYSPADVNAEDTAAANAAAKKPAKPLKLALNMLADPTTAAHTHAIVAAVAAVNAAAAAKNAENPADTKEYKWEEHTHGNDKTTDIY